MDNPLNHETFADFVVSKKFTVIYFWASWSSYNKDLRALLQSAIPCDLRERIAFATFSTDPQENYAICEQNQIKNVPAFAFYCDGSHVRTITGLLTADAFAQHLRNLIDDGSADEIVCEGYWLYDGSVRSGVRVRRSHVWPGSGDCEDSPEMYEDREIDCYYVERGSPDGRAGGSKCQPFATIAEAKAYVDEASHHTVDWRHEAASA